MRKYIITWNIGYGEMAEVVDAKNEKEAQELAYDRAREDFESSADYEAIPYDKKTAKDLGAE